MAHTCPNCYAYCTCNGDWDDIDFGDDPECVHCSADGRHSADDFDGGYSAHLDAAEQGVHPTLVGGRVLQGEELEKLISPANVSG